MRALLTLLILALPLAGCDKPAADAYWKSQSTQKTDIVSRDFDKLMAEGTRANLAGRPSEAEGRFREALAVRRKQAGNDSPDLALPLMSLALQLSAQQEYSQADAQFAEAERVMRTSKDRALRARLAHYRGEHMLNQDKPAEADALLRAAEADYIASIPPEALTRAPVPKTPLNRFDVNSGGRVSTAGNYQVVDGKPSSRPALLGLIEVLRYRAIAARELGQSKDADVLTAQAARIAAGNDLDRASVYARVYRTSGVNEAAQAHPDRALADLARSDRAFETALPGTKPAAEGALLRAGELVRAGQTGAALSICRRAVQTLIAISAGTSPELMAPCLDAYAAGGLFSSGASNRAEMFVAAQVAQGTITSHQIAQASASLAENARNPEVGKALHERDRLQRELDRIYRALDTIGPGATSGRAADEIAALQLQADQTQAGLTSADAEVRRLSPNYGQLVQDVVPASDVFASLRPDEAFAALILSQNEGWVFLLRNNEISIAKIEGGASKAGPLVKAIRAGIEQTQAASLPTFDIDSTRALYDLTLGGVESQLKGVKSLVVAPTGPLLSVPFELLLTGPADPAKLAAAPWLIRRFTITHVPAATNFVSLRKVANLSKAAKPWFGFGEFQPVTVAQAQTSFPVGLCGDAGALLASLPPLPGAAKELEGARQVLGAAQGDELLGQAYTANQVLNTSLKDYRILHFAAHALLPTDIRCQTEAAIVTSPPAGAVDAKGALLTASKLLGLDLDANLVILSACNSGGPGGGAGESLSGLARSFFFARARSLLVTHWSVSDQVAALLVVMSMDNLKKDPGQGVTGALRSAQLNLLDQAAEGKLPPEIAHPFFWAPFALIGDGGEGGKRDNDTRAVSSRL